MRLISLQEVKDFLDKTDTDHDSLLLSLIEMTSKRIETYLNRTLKYGTYTEKSHARGITSYWVKAFPIDSSQPLTVKRDGTTLTLDTDYYLDYENGVIYFSTPQYSTKPLALEVTYTGGYKEGIENILLVPDDLKKACLYQVAYEFKRRHELGATAFNMPDGSLQIQPIGLLPEVEKILRAYRRFPV